jgi:hypothetical protein
MKLSFKPSFLLTVGLITVGLLTLGSLVLYFLSSAPTRTGSAITDPTRCPVCGRELPRSAQGTGQCPFCELDKLAGKYKGGETSRGNLTVPILLGSLFLVLLGVHVFVLVRARRKAGAPAEPSYPLFCPKCHRKLRYRHSQGGRLGQCPLCKRPIPFPKPPQPRHPWHVRVWKKVMG